MKRISIVAAALAALAMAAYAQPVSNVIAQPDCIIFFHFTANNQSSPTAPNNGLDNRATGCTTWNISAVSTGFASFTVALQSAPNTTVAGAPGTYVTFLNQTLILGSNPIVSAVLGGVGFGWLTGYNPWVRVKVTAIGAGSGIIDGAAFGWRIPGASATTPGAIPGSVNLAQFGGVNVTLGQKLPTASMPTVQAQTCSQIALVDTTASGLKEIVPLSAGKKVRLCAVFINVVQPSASPADFGLATGTGSNCGGATASLTQQWQGVISTIQSFTQQTADGVLFEGPISNAVCLQTSAAPTSAKVQVIYDYY